MAQVTIYHNPRCSKSRQTLALLREHQIEPVVVEYLKTPLDAATIKSLLAKLKMKPRDLVRVKEYRALGLTDTVDDKELIEQIAAHPVVLERPIVVVGRQAVLGRPPENVLQII